MGGSVVEGAGRAGVSALDEVGVLGVLLDPSGVERARGDDAKTLLTGLVEARAGEGGGDPATAELRLRDRVGELDGIRRAAELREPCEGAGEEGLVAVLVVVPADLDITHAPQPVTRPRGRSRPDPLLQAESPRRTRRPPGPPPARGRGVLTEALDLVLPHASTPTPDDGPDLDLPDADERHTRACLGGLRTDHALRGRRAGPFRRSTTR